jgi:hypothetical protein
VGFDDGFVYGSGLDYGDGVRCVRAGEASKEAVPTETKANLAPTDYSGARFVDNGDGTAAHGDMTWQAVKEQEPRVAGPEQKPQGKNQLGTIELPRNLPQPKVKESATGKEKTEAVGEEPQAGDCAALVGLARVQGRYDRAVKLLNSNVCKDNAQVPLLWESLGNSVWWTNAEQACEWWKRAMALAKDQRAVDRLEKKLDANKCK